MEGEGRGGDRSEGKGLAQCYSPLSMALRGTGRKDSRAHGQPWLHRKLEAKLVYKTPCLNKSKTNKQIKENNGML